MNPQEENIIRFPINRTKNFFDCTEYKPKHTNNRVPVKKVDQVATKVNKILKTDEKKRSNYDLILSLMLGIWCLLALAIMLAFHRKQSNITTGGLPSFEINLYMLLTSLSISVYVLIVLAYNKSIDQTWKLIQKFLMDKNQVSMKSGYRWIIAMPSTNAMDIIPYRKLNFTNLELRKDYWDMDDLDLGEEGQQSSIEFPYIVRKNHYSFQFYTPRLSNFRFSLQEISKFFGKVEQILTHDTPIGKFLVVWIEFSSTALVTLLLNLLILVLLALSLPHFQKTIFEISCFEFHPQKSFFIKEIKIIIEFNGPINKQNLELWCAPYLGRVKRYPIKAGKGLRIKDQKGTEFALFIVFIVLYCLSLRIAATLLNRITTSQYKRLQNILILQNSDLEAIKNSTWELGELIPMKKNFLTSTILVFGSLKLNLAQGFEERYVDDEAYEEEDSDKAESSPNMNVSMSEYFFPKEI